MKIEIAQTNHVADPRAATHGRERSVDDYKAAFSVFDRKVPWPRVDQGLPREGDARGRGRVRLRIPAAVRPDAIALVKVDTSPHSYGCTGSVVRDRRRYKSLARCYRSQYCSELPGPRIQERPYLPTYLASKFWTRRSPGYPLSQSCRRRARARRGWLNLRTRRDPYLGVERSDNAHFSEDVFTTELRSVAAGCAHG